MGSHQWRKLLPVVAVLLYLVAFVPAVSARHGEENILTNRIPEPAPYAVEETTTAGGAFGAPHTNQPFENLWATTNDSGGCDGCHTGLWNQWNGAMMSNAWRDPGWRGAFLLVARLTSTDGNCDIPNPPDGSARNTALNPFSSGCTSIFNNGTGTVTYNTSGSLMDDFCSRCHMPANYADAVTSVFNDAPSGQEHGRISPSFDPTACVGSVPECYPGTVTTMDPVTGQSTPESFAERSYVDGVTRVSNSNSGKAGIICEVCHTNVATRYTPYHNYNKTGTEYYPARQNTGRWDAANGLTIGQQDMVAVPDATIRNQGYGIGAGAWRLSPHALNLPERFGPLSWNGPCALVPTSPCVTDPFLGQNAVVDSYVSDVFTGGTRTYTAYLTWASPPGKHDTFYQVKFERSEFCAACHDVTNPITIKNQFGYWVGGFPIERTYTEWANSRYAHRPGNTNYVADFKRDCQTCHMQQSYGQPGTALTLYDASGPLPPLIEPSCDRISHNPGYSHHFVGGNAYITKMVGADIDGGGVVQPYPELLYTSFSSSNPSSRYYYARYDTTGTRSGITQTQHERFAWDRMRNVITMSLTPAVTSVSRPATETLVGLNVTIQNDGSGHNFPTGFPEGRAAWVHIRAWDTRNTADTSDDVELNIQNSAAGNIRSLGVGNLTSAEMTDPTFPAACNWKIPAGSIDPYAFIMRAVATLDKTCPTLDLPYATPVNLVVNANNMPTDAAGNVIDRNNPLGLPRYTDADGDGDLFDDSFLKDTRLRPRAATAAADAGSRVALTQYSIVVPSTVVGPIAVTSIVYYQAFEGVVARKFLGNLANLDDTDTNEGYPGGSPLLETCVLKGACDRVGKAGATGETQLRSALLFDPIVVEGAPPMPMTVQTKVIQVVGTTDNVPPRLNINNCKPPRRGTATCNTNLAANITTALVNTKQYPHWSPSPYGGPTGNFATEGYGELNVDHRRVIKVSFSEPVTGVDRNTFYLTDSGGAAVDFLINQLDATTFALFPYESTEAVFLSGGGYIIHVAPTRGGSTIRDFNGNILPNGPAAGGEYTFGFKAA